MGKYDSILDKLQKSASDRDAGTAKEKCPKKRKPAIYVAVLRGDTAAPVKDVTVHIGQPTGGSPTTNSDGEVKVDPAKVGKHRVRVDLSPDQEKEYAASAPVEVTTSKGRTSVLFFLLEPLPKLLVEVKYREGYNPVDGVRVRVGKVLEGQSLELSTSGGKTDFGCLPAGKHRVTVTFDKPLETKAEVFFRGEILRTFEPGHTVSWHVDLPYGDSKSFLVLIARSRWIEIQLRDEEGDPVGSAQYRVALLNGKEVTHGTLDSMGCARVENIPAAECKFMYTNRDNQTWVFGVLGSVPQASEVLTPLKAPPHWIEIELRDEEGDPVDGAQYRVVLLNGKEVAQGTLDSKGWARIENIPTAECEIIYTNRDSQTWVFGLVGG